MRRFRVHALWQSALVVALIAITAVPSAGQSVATEPPIRIPPVATPDDVVRLLEAGRQLEAQGRWTDALSHYEDALKQHPGNRSLASQLDLAKIHFSLKRRSGDTSFAESVAVLDAESADQLYGEILTKINKHYVSTPNWARLVARGTMALDVALADAEYCRRNCPSASRRRIDNARREMYQVVGRQPIHTVQDARRAVATTAAYLRRQLGISEAAVTLEYVAGATGGLDDYSTYLTAGQLKDTYSQIEGNFVGLGVELKGEKDALHIVHVISGSPAQKAGIKPGDRIVAVESRPVSQLSTDVATTMLQGQEGTTVRLTMVTPGQRPRQIAVRRQHVDVPSVEKVSIVDRDYGIGYIKLPSFQKTTSRDLDRALWQLHGQGMRTLILDLRGNPGGLLTASVEVADKFIQRGRIVSTRGRSAEEDFNYIAHEAGTWRVPLVVLIDHDSASASEVFAGAISDHRRGLVVGTTSYGKGTVQAIFPLSRTGAGIRLTTARFYSPAGHAISKVGIKPDIDHHLAARVPAGQNLANANQRDAILKAGIEAARSQLSKASR